jgi:hypothetical protein
MQLLTPSHEMSNIELPISNDEVPDPLHTKDATGALADPPAYRPSGAGRHPGSRSTFIIPACRASAQARRDSGTLWVFDIPRGFFVFGSCSDGSGVEWGAGWWSKRAGRLIP